MMDATFFLGDKIAAPAISCAQRYIVEVHQDHYNLDRVKELVLNSLALIEGKVDVMLNVDFKTARDALASWERSAERPDSPTQMANLLLARDCARKAIHSVQDPRDKLSALSILLLAEYKLVALSQQTDAGEWSAAKEHVERLLVQFVSGFRELRTAAQEELEGRHRRRNFFLIRSPGKRRDLLRQFMALKTNLAKLPPIHIMRGIQDVNDDLAYIAKAAKKLMGCQATIRCREIVVCCCTVDGHKVLTGGKALRLWNLITGKQIMELRGHTAQIACCDAIGIKGLSGSYDRTLRVWDLRNGTELKVLVGHTNWIWCCRLFHGGRMAMTGSIDKTVRVWDLEKNRQSLELVGHDDWIRCCCVFDNGRKALSGDDSNTLRLWNLDSGNLLNRLCGHNGFVSCCAVFDDNNRAVSGSFDKTLIVWSLQDSNATFKLIGHTKAVTCCCIAHHGRHVVSGGADKMTKVWCVYSGAQLHSYAEHSDHVLSCCVFSCETIFVTGGGDKTLRMWEMPERIAIE